jgi:hypothetical protein
MRGLVPPSHRAVRSGQRASRPSTRAARVLAALGAGYLSVTACAYSDYPIEATLCDDWCRVLRRTGCEQEPENCIRDCEASLPSERCRPHQVTLLGCYESTPAARFECVGQGFQSSVRPLPQICTEQRHALIRCEVPRVMTCIEACIALDTSAQGGTEGALVASDAGVSASAGPCPEPPFPCERLCWELDARRADPMSSGASSQDELTALGEPYIRCALERAAACRAGSPEAAMALPVSWTRLFLECAGMPGEPGESD